jgi:predicted aldo/keto reductase-like oxidoreductase
MGTVPIGLPDRACIRGKEDIQMEKRRFGRTNHWSTIIVFGGFAVGPVSQEEADATMALLMEHGVNHIDVAPSYYDAELRLGPWMEKHRDRFFLGCKTQLRSRTEARAELERSLARLRVEAFDLFQLHAVATMEELDQCFAPGGSLEAILEAREEGLTRYVGITSHGWLAPAVQLEALRRFDFDSLLLPLNFKMWADDDYQRTLSELLEVTADRDVGTMVIKTWAQRPWGEETPTYHTWYKPFDEPEMVERTLRFTLSQPITAAISAGDSHLLPAILAAAERFAPMDKHEQAQLLSLAGQYEPIFERESED